MPVCEPCAVLIVSTVTHNYEPMLLSIYTFISESTALVHQNSTVNWADIH